MEPQGLVDGTTGACIPQHNKVLTLINNTHSVPISKKNLMTTTKRK